MELDGFGRSTDQLIERICELERLNRGLLRQDELEARLEYAWTGNLGRWYCDTKTNSVIFNPLKVTALGYDREDIPEQADRQFLADRLHPEDYEKVM